MSFFITHVVLPILGLSLALYALGIWCGLWPTPFELFGEKAVEIAICGCPEPHAWDEACGDYGYGIEIEIPEKAVEIPEPALVYYGPPTFAEADLMLRIRAPRLFDKTAFVPECNTRWFIETRREFAATTRRWREERAQFRKEMGLAT